MTLHPLVVALHVALRGAALFLGAFAGVNAVAAMTGGADANRWWIDLRGAPPAVSHPALLAAGALLAAWTLRPDAGSTRRVATSAAAAGLCVLTALDAVTVLRLGLDGAVRTAGLPMSSFLAVFFGVAVVVVARARSETDATTASSPPRRTIAVLVASVAAAALFPLGQMATFGRSDYRREADVIVVFGARTWADGRPSVALADRMRTACDAWKWARSERPSRAVTLFLSGGPGDGPTHETEAMASLAIAAGVPETSLVRDPEGRNTRATVRNAAAWMRSTGASRALAVSHAYHLPRVRMEFDRAGVAAFTVPAEESYVLSKMPWFMAREVAAWWASWAAETIQRTEHADG